MLKNMIKVLQMMDDYGVASRFPVRKEWYDGYAFEHKIQHLNLKKMLSYVKEARH